MSRKSDEEVIEHCNLLLANGYDLEEISNLVGLEDYEIFESWLFEQIEDEHL